MIDFTPITIIVIRNTKRNKVQLRITIIVVGVKSIISIIDLLNSNEGNEDIIHKQYTMDVLTFMAYSNALQAGSLKNYRR